MLFTKIVNRSAFSTITHIRGSTLSPYAGPSLRAEDEVELRGIHIKSSMEDSPNLIFIPEAFDQAENWLQFFSNPANKIASQRNVWILYPRNFGNSDRNPNMSWESHANDVLRFMYTHRISMATLAGHGLGGKVALATGCYHPNYVTGFYGIDTVPHNQHFYEPLHELRANLQALQSVSLHRSYQSIVAEIKAQVKCPKWRSIFENNLVRQDGQYEWKFDFEAVSNNFKTDSPNSMAGWSSAVGLYPGRACFAFPDNSRFVHLSTNTLAMLKVCPQLQGFGEDIFSIQGDENPQNHWVYEREDEVNPYAWRMAHFLKNYDGVHSLLKNREEVGKYYIPDIHLSREPRDELPTDRSPGHYHHNWRFNNIYNTQK